MMRRWASLRESLAAQLWPLPTAVTILAVAAGIVIPMFDSAVDQDLPDSLRWLLFGGGAGSAREVLSAIAGSLITVTSLTFSLTVVALQLASSQFSPRLLRMFASDWRVHATLAVFLGTFAYALTVLRTIRSEGSTSEEVVPLFAVTLASLLAFVSVITLALFIGYLARQLRVETMLRDVNDETRRTIALVGEQSDAETVEVAPGIRPSHANAVTASASGFITSVDHASLIELATEHDIVLEEEHRVGASVIAGVPLVSWWPSDGRSVTAIDDLEHLEAAVNAAYTLGYERTPSQDIEFGLRQLSDIASKALSPGVNDPTTAEHALSHVSTLLCSIAALPEQYAGLADENGTLRLITRPLDFAHVVELGIEQPRRYGASDPSVAARLFQLLREVGYNARTSQQREIVRAQAARLLASVRAQDYDDTEMSRFDGLAATVDAAVGGHWN